MKIVYYYLHNKDEMTIAAMIRQENDALHIVKV